MNGVHVVGWRLVAWALLGLVLAIGRVDAAGVISVNLTEYNSAAQNIVPDQVYGVAELGSAVSGWTNMNQVASSFNLPFDDGAASTVWVQLTAPNWFATTDAAYNSTPLKGMIDDYTATINPVGLTMYDLNWNYPQGYFAIVYLSGYNLNEGASISDGTTTYYYQPLDLRSTTWDGTLVQTTTTSDLGYGNAPVAQYAVFGSRQSPLFGDSITFTLDTLYGGGAGIGGVQLVSASAAPGDIVIDVPSGTQTQAEAGYPSIATATSVTKTGGGMLVFDAANGYSGPTTISAGTLQVADPGGLGASNVTVDTTATLSVASGTTIAAPSVIIDGGTLSAASLVVESAAGIASLAINAGTIAGGPSVSIGAGGQMALVQDARVAVLVGGLSIAEGASGGRLDLGAGQVSVAAGGVSAADLRADIIAGRNGGGWNGSTGITSSTAAASGGTRSVGYVVAGDGSAKVSFAAAGDVDLSGAVNVFDLVSVNSSGKYGSGTSSVWSQGDFNYDGVTNVFDLVGVNTAGAYGQGDYFPAAPTASGVTAVPEPAAWAILAATSGLLVCRRRGRNQS